MKLIFRRHGRSSRNLPIEPTLNAVVPVESGECGVGSSDLFKLPANTRLWRTSKQAPSYAGEVAKLYRDVFTPSHPKQSMDGFTGRADTILSIAQSIEEEHAHIFLLGHRLLGKSSLLNVIAAAARQAGYLVARIPCTADLTFNGFLRAIFDELSDHLEEAPAGDVLNKRVGVERLSDLIAPDVENVQAALHAFSRIATQQVVVVVDDFHRIRDAETKQKIFDLLATLRARNASVSMVIAARNDINEECDLFDGDPSSGAITVRLEPMRPDEISEMLRSGGRRLGVRFGEDVLQAVNLLCQGIPAIAQWIGLLTARRALRRYDGAVSLDDVVEAARETAVKTDRYACALLDRALGSQSAGRLDDVLYLAARTSAMYSTEFSATDINRAAAHAGQPPFTEQGLHRLLTKFTKGQHAIFRRSPHNDGASYLFADPLLRPIVLLRNAGREQPCDTDILAAYLQHQHQALLGSPKSDAADDFLHWLRFVLPTEDVALYSAWTEQDPAANREFRAQFRRAHDDRALEALLREIHDVLTNVAPEKPDSEAMDAA